MVYLGPSVQPSSSALVDTVCPQSLAGFSQSAITRKLTDRFRRNFRQMAGTSSSIAQDVSDVVLDSPLLTKAPDSQSH